MFTGRYSFHLVLLAAVISGSAFGQPDISFPDSGAVWTNALYYYPPPPPSPELWELVNFCAYGEDTLMLGGSYKKIDTCNAGYKGAIRVLDDRVFFVPRDSVTEYLLYDLTLSAGDIAYNVYWEAGGDARVSNVQIYNDVEWPMVPGRRAFYTNIGTWIQGVGGYGGLFMEAGPNVSKVLLQLECMSRWDTVLVGTGPCPIFLGASDLLGLSPTTALPNPTNGTVSIRPMILSDDIAIRIYTYTGGEVSAPYVLRQDELIIDLSALRTGVYLIEVSERGRRHVHRVCRVSDRSCAIHTSITSSSAAQKLERWPSGVSPPTVRRIASRSLAGPTYFTFPSKFASSR